MAAPPEPTFYTNDSRLSFWTTIEIHPEFLEDHISQEIHDGVHHGVHVQNLSDLSETDIRILKLAEEHPVGRDAILADFGYSTRTRNIRSAISRLLRLQLISYTILDKPRSKKQQYRITVKGKEILRNH